MKFRAHRCFKRDAKYKFCDHCRQLDVLLHYVSLYTKEFRLKAGKEKDLKIALADSRTLGNEWR